MAMVLPSARNNRNDQIDPMSEIPRKDNPARCAICDTYNLKGLWTCECGALNVSQNKECWKCSRPRGEVFVQDPDKAAEKVRSEKSL
jgi:hypothetical protein